MFTLLKTSICQDPCFWGALIMSVIISVFLIFCKSYLSWSQGREKARMWITGGKKINKKNQCPQVVVSLFWQPGLILILSDIDVGSWPLASYIRKQKGTDNVAQCTFQMDNVPRWAEVGVWVGRGHTFTWKTGLCVSLKPNHQSFSWN